MANDKRPEDELQAEVDAAIRDAAAKLVERKDAPVDLGPIIRRWIEEKLPHAAKDRS